MQPEDPHQGGAGHHRVVDPEPGRLPAVDGAGEHALDVPSRRHLVAHVVQGHPDDPLAEQLSGFVRPAGGQLKEAFGEG